jgi:hypothetical protein
MGLYLALERVEAVGKFFNVPEADVSINILGAFQGRSIPLRWTALHGLTAELTSSTRPLAARAGFGAILAGRVAPNLPTSARLEV